MEVTDYSKPETESYIIEDCEIDSVITGYDAIEKIDEKTGKIEIYESPIIENVENCINVTKQRTIYPHTKIEEGVKVESEVELLRQALYELKQKVEYLEDNCQMKVVAVPK
jgi:hypothetical protein